MDHFHLFRVFFVWYPAQTITQRLCSSEWYEYKSSLELFMTPLLFLSFFYAFFYPVLYLIYFNLRGSFWHLNQGEKLRRTGWNEVKRKCYWVMLRKGCHERRGGVSRICLIYQTPALTARGLHKYRAFWRAHQVLTLQLSKLCTLV